MKDNILLSEEQIIYLIIGLKNIDNEEIEEDNSYIRRKCSKLGIKTIQVFAQSFFDI